MKYLFLFSMLLSLACKDAGRLKYKNELPDSASKASIKYNNDYLVDSTQINGFSVCDDLDKIIKRRKFYKKKIFEQEDQSWLGYYFKTIDSNWILVENRGIESNRVSRITTNSPLYHTGSGVRCGADIGYLLEKKIRFEVNSEMGEFSLHLEDNDLWVKVDHAFNDQGIYGSIENGSISEEDIFKLINKKAIIREISILSYCN